MPFRGNRRGRGGFPQQRNRGYETDNDQCQDSDYQWHDGPDPSLPTTFQAWVIGILTGGTENWMKPYVESRFFETARQSFKTRAGFDVQWLVTSFMLYSAAKEKLPAVVDKTVFQVTSSVTIESHWIGKSIIELASKQSTSSATSGLMFGGQHVNFVDNDTHESSSEASPRFFWYDGTLFILQTEGSFANKDDSPPDDNSGGYNSYDYEQRYGSSSGNGKMVLCCFGRTTKPIEALITHCEQLNRESEKLQVTKYFPGNGESKVDQLKRPMSTIDLEDELLTDIREDSERFFHPSSKRFYEAAGTPYRRGYILYGPPGTGKSSLSSAIASNANVPLIKITLKGMDDSELEATFEKLPAQCVVLLEDIDCAGTTRNDEEPRSASTKQAVDEAIETAVQSALTKQAAENQRLISQMMESKHPGTNYHSSANIQQAPAAPKAPKQITLSGLLNVIDGVGAKEGRLLIMTTNAPRSLDKALYRAGRVDRRFEIGYATKLTAEKTFKRIFGAFRDQFPKLSKLPTAEISEYCASRRGRPDKAVTGFPEFLRKFRTGEDAFNYDIKSVEEVPEGDTSNLPDDYDQSLLEERPGDRVKSKAVQLGKSEQKTTTKSWWGWFPFGSTSTKPSSTQAKEDEAVYWEACRLITGLDMMPGDFYPYFEEPFQGIDC
ncbi:hypothetical protein BDV95DRAFT_561370 [Massariosphaeria phaeospora]|uniref:AAA+ ATPase domain-containing protein n=1 Tax=Massariosphaeria phaeospora TaxID=100035 RepID=A0A7C8MH45_9PLEO|nr:hypothetical protein BDV95DRAFT_561370 [Massariosphaeria phaeospora]